MVAEPTSFMDAYAMIKAAYAEHGLRYFSVAINMAHDENPEWPFWCNARTTAIGFYEQVDWSVETDIFDIPTAGPHVRMYYCRE